MTYADGMFPAFQGELARELQADLSHEMKRFVAHAKGWILRARALEAEEGRTLVHVSAGQEAVVACEVFSGRTVLRMGLDEALRDLKEKYTPRDLAEIGETLAAMALVEKRVDTLEPYLCAGEEIDSEWWEEISEECDRELGPKSFDRGDVGDVLERFFLRMAPVRDPEFALFLGVSADDAYVAHVFALFENGRLESLESVAGSAPAQ